MTAMTLAKDLSPAEKNKSVEVARAALARPRFRRRLEKLRECPL